MLFQTLILTAVLSPSLSGDQPPKSPVRPSALEVKQYLGCYWFQLPVDFGYPFWIVDAKLESEATRHDSHFRLVLEPRSPLTTGWHLRSDRASITWSTGEDGFIIGLRKQAELFSATLVRFSDALSFGPWPEVEIPVTQIDCSAFGEPPSDLKAYPKGTLVKIRSLYELEGFNLGWPGDRLTGEQLRSAGDTAKVVNAKYHGGYFIYSLEKLPGTWHELCLEPAPSSRKP